jgi:hypothetical protein
MATVWNFKIMKMAVFWFVAPRNLVEVYERFRDTWCFHHGSLMMEAAISSETSVNFNQSTRRNNPENSGLQARHRENLKSYFEIISDKFNQSLVYFKKLLSAAAQPKSSQLLLLLLLLQQIIIICNTRHVQWVRFPSPYLLC